MTSPSDQLSSARVAKRRLTKLVYGRLLVSTLILLATWLFGGTYISGGAKGPPSMLSTYVAVVVLSVVYIIAKRLSGDFELQAKTQVWIDILLVSALVWQTDGFSSPYVALYVMATSVAGYNLSRIETILYSGCGAFAFLIVSLAVNSDTLFSDERTRVGAMQGVAFTTAGILFVGLLASRLADKRSVGEELKETVESLADMRTLHERIVDSISSGLITTDLKGDIFAFNPAAAGILGLNPEEAKGRSIFSVLGAAARAPFELCVGPDAQSAFATPAFDAEVAAAESGGTSDVSIACTMSPLIGRSGQASGVIITIQDMTAIRAMEESLRRNDRLAAVGRMSAGLAHEIRNPLGSMGAALQFLKEKESASAEDKELLEIALREAERLEQIISNFLVYARPNNPVYAKDGLADTDLNQAIRDCVSLLEHSPERTVHHNIRCSLPTEPVIVRANESQIKQVFWNLSRNSMQAMPDGGDLSVALDCRSEKHVRITFEDTGKGIGREQLDKIFEPFSDGASGTGLGLSIVHKIVTEHGGRIDIESELNKGTKVTVELPQ